MRFFLINILLSSILFLLSCSNNINKDIKFKRFDIDLYNAINNIDTSYQTRLIEDYPVFFELYYSGILGGATNDTNYYDKLNYIKGIISVDNFNNLYNSVLSEFSDLSSEEIILNKSISNFHKLFPNYDFPELYTHISPFGYSIITSDSLISVSLDNYLGDDFSGYNGFYHKYQLSKRNRERIVPDIFKGWIYANFNSSFIKNIADGMIYEGAVIYAIKNIVPNCNEAQIIGYNNEQIEWLEKNEKRIWDSIINSNHLYSTNTLLYSKYMNEAPFCAALGRDVPAEVGKWIGLKIVSKYINNTGINVVESILKGNIPTVEILKSYN